MVYCLFYKKCIGYEFWRVYEGMFFFVCTKASTIYIYWERGDSNLKANISRISVLTLGQDLIDIYEGMCEFFIF